VLQLPSFGHLGVELRATFLVGGCFYLDGLGFRGAEDADNFHGTNDSARPLLWSGAVRGLVGGVGRIEKRTRFTLARATYEHADPEPSLPEGSVRRFTLGAEPQVIAQVPLAGGGTVEVHGYATHYNQDWVSVTWNDDNVHQFDCWVPAADVRRPAEGEWRGHYVQF
jgi:hypothetical protein